MHKVKYKLCREACVGNKQNFLKQRIQGHMNDAVKQKNQNIYSDAFTNYSANHLPSKSLSAKDAKPLLKVWTIKCLNPIEVLQGFGTDKYQLCVKERNQIASRLLKDSPLKLINKNAKIYSAWCSKAKFHVCEQKNNLNGTDEGVSQKKKQDDSVHVISDNEEL